MTSAANDERPSTATVDMDADIDRILSLSGSLGLGLPTCLDDYADQHEQSISPQSIGGIATGTSTAPFALSSTTGTSNNGRSTRTNLMDVLTRIVVGNTTTTGSTSSSIKHGNGDDDFILADIVGLSSSSGISHDETKHNDDETEEEGNEHERLLQLLLSSAGGPSSTTSATATNNGTAASLLVESSFSVELASFAERSGVGSDAYTTPSQHESSTSATSAKSGDNTTATTTTTTSTTDNTNSTTSSTPPRRPSPTLRVSPTEIDTYYRTILDDLRLQMRPIQQAAEIGQSERYGMTWRDLLDIVLLRIHPLAATSGVDQVEEGGSTTASATSSSAAASTIVPMRHYQPLLLECARIWRRSLREAIERNKEKDEKEEDGNDKIKNYRILHPKDRHYLAHQAARIVERFLHMHQVFPREEPANADTNASAGNAYKVRPWDDFSESNVVDSVRFLDFVYVNILQPAYKMGWEDLAYEFIDDPTYYVKDRTTKKDPTNIDEAGTSPNPSVEMLRFSPYLYGPVVGAIHTIIAKVAGRDDVEQRALSDQQDAGDDDVIDLLTMISVWKSSSHVQLNDLGVSPRSILKAKLDSLCRVVVVGPEDDRCTPRPFINNKKGYTLEEAGRVMRDCLLSWRVLARYRLENTYRQTYSAHRQIRDNVASELVDYAVQIAHHFKRIHGIDIRSLTNYDNVRTVEETVKVMDFVYNGFLLPAKHIGVHNLSSHIMDVEGRAQTFSSLVGHGILHLHSTLYLEAGASREAKLFDHKLRSIGIGTRAHVLRFELTKLEGCTSERIASGEADHLLRNCLASWKDSSREVLARRFVETREPHEIDEVNKAEAELIKLADELVQQYQRLHRMNADGIDFFLSSIGESCLILDFIYEHFLSFGLGLGINFIRDDSLCGGVGLAPSNKFYSYVDYQMNNGNYDFLELIANAIQNLEDKGDVETAGYYYDKISRAGNGECKVYLEAELPSYAIKQ